MKKILLVALSFVLVLLTACSPNVPGADLGESESGSESENKTEYRTISPEAAKTLLDNGKELVLVDVRTAEEYAEKHIPGAILIPNEEIGDSRPEELSDLDTTIIVYCRSGNRSKTASEKLIAMGYTDVRDLGGINDWPYATVTGNEVGVWSKEDTAAKTGVLSSFTATDLNGTKIDESILVDYELTMVNVWATFCGPCLREMPDLGELAAEYEAQGVRIVGMISDVLDSKGNIDATQVATAKDIVAQTNADYLHILPSEDLLGLIAGIQSVPTTFFVDKDGNQVGKAYVGSRSKADWKTIIDETLAEVSE